MSDNETRQQVIKKPFTVEQFAEWAFAIVVAAVVTFFLVLACTSITMCAVSSDQSDYCFVKHEQFFDRDGELKSYVLVQHVKWASNRNAGSFKTFDEAVAASKEIGCELR